MSAGEWFFSRLNADIKPNYNETKKFHTTRKVIVEKFITRDEESKVVSNAIKDGYRTLVMKNRHPVVILFITINASFVTVNCSLLMVF